MKIESVTWKTVIATKGIQAIDAYKALESIRKNNSGQLTDDAVVAAAKPQNHVLHSWFEWDDTEAAIEYRRNQARTLMRSLAVTYKEAPELKVRAYQVSVKTRPQNQQRTVYSTTEEVLRNPESRDRLIAQAIKAAMEFRNRFKHLHELEMVIKSIDEVLVKLGMGE